MAQSSHRNYNFGGDSSRFPKPFAEENVPSSRCFWPGCKAESWIGLCFMHAIDIYGLVREMLVRQDTQIAAELLAERGIPTEPLVGPRPKPDAYVYYLMVGPSTVKIGTTIDLHRRLVGLRSDLQYVVAIERGGMDLERQRHREFAAERIGRREDFRLSDRLKAHIEALQPYRDELILRTAQEIPMPSTPETATPNG